MAEGREKRRSGQGARGTNVAEISAVGVAVVARRTCLVGGAARIHEARCGRSWARGTAPPVEVDTCESFWYPGVCWGVHGRLLLAVEVEGGLWQGCPLSFRRGVSIGRVFWTVKWGEGASSGSGRRRS